MGRVLKGVPRELRQSVELYHIYKKALGFYGVHHKAEVSGGSVHRLHCGGRHTLNNTFDKEELIIISR